MELSCLDLEGVLVPEIWIAFAERTGIDELRATTRDIPDYDVLMKQRLGLLDQHQLKIGARLVIPVGRTTWYQELVRVTRIGEAEFRTEDLVPVRFVPLIGEEGWDS